MRRQGKTQYRCPIKYLCEKQFLDRAYTSVVEILEYKVEAFKIIKK